VLLFHISLGSLWRALCSVCNHDTHSCFDFIQRSSPLALTWSLTARGRKQHKGVRTGDRGGHAIGLPSPVHRPGKFAFNDGHWAKRKVVEVSGNGGNVVGARLWRSATFRTSTNASRAALPSQERNGPNTKTLRLSRHALKVHRGGGGHSSKALRFAYWQVQRCEMLSHHWRQHENKYVQLCLSCKIGDFTAVTMKNAVFWDVTPCGYCKNRCLRRTYRFHRQGDKNLWTRNNVSSN
jgi:hypothetical protein